MQREKFNFFSAFEMISNSKLVSLMVGKRNVVLVSSKRFSTYQSTQKFSASIEVIRKLNKKLSFLFKIIFAELYHSTDIRVSDCGHMNVLIDTWYAEGLHYLLMKTSESIVTRLQSLIIMLNLISLQFSFKFDYSCSIMCPTTVYLLQ